MRQSDQIEQLAAALAAAQGEMEGATKDSENSGLKNEQGKFAKYADLASVWGACRAPLSKNGLAVVQTPGSVNIKGREIRRMKKWDKFAKKEYEQDEVVVDAEIPIKTLLVHISGQFIEETLTMPITKFDAHGIGSAITYGRRYALAAMVGVYQEDDDGNGASGKDSEKGPDQGQPQGQPTPAAAHQQPAQPQQAQPPKQQAPANGQPQGQPAPQAQKAAPPPDAIQQIKQGAVAVGAKTAEDFAFVLKEILGVEQIDATTPMPELQRLYTFIKGLYDDGIAFADWKARVIADQQTLTESVQQNGLDPFPGMEEMK